MNTMRLAALFAVIFSLSLAPAASAQGVYWGSETVEAKQLEQQYAAKRGTMGRAGHAMIAACHNRSVDIGLAILERGGNAVDAFIAVTFADYVQAPGASSLGGPLGALVHDARSGTVDHLSAPLKTAADPAAQWRVGASARGMQVLIPGAAAGLELMHRKRGKLPWRELVAPAERLAREGFPVDYLYAAILANSRATLAQSDYGRATFLHVDGSPLKPGDTLKLPALAATLADIGKHGARVMYRGQWAAEAVREIAALGGRIGASDFAGYEAAWVPALRTDYRGRRIYGPSAHDSGGARLALALDVLEHTDLRTLGHYSESLDALETMMHVVDAVNAVPALNTHAFFTNPRAVQALVDGNTHEALWKDVQAKTHRLAPAPVGSHSYSVVVVDAAGNAVAGTHTIESLPFGSGIFVGGVPLNNTAMLHPFTDTPYSTPPGSYLVEPLSATLAFRGKQLLLASSTFSAALWPADLQLVVSALDFDWTPERIALTPRFGGYAVDLAKMTADTTTMTLDKRYAAATVAAMGQRGRRVSQAGYVDTGMLVMVKRDPATGELTGFTPEQLPDGRAAGY